MVDAAAESGRIGMTEPLADALADFRRFNYEHVYLRPASRAQADAVIALLRALVEHYGDRPHLLPDPPRAAGGTDDAVARRRVLRRRHDRPLRLPPGRVPARLGPRQAPPGRDLTVLSFEPARSGRARTTGRTVSGSGSRRARGRSSVTSTPVTSARGGPIRHQATISATAASGPSKTASTVPSMRLRTHPATSRATASRRQDSRNQTPCTRPETTTR